MNRLSKRELFIYRRGKRRNLTKRMVFCSYIKVINPELEEDQS